jgi:hypothetical protein
MPPTFEENDGLGSHCNLGQWRLLPRFHTCANSLQTILSVTKKRGMNKQVSMVIQTCSAVGQNFLQFITSWTGLALLTESTITKEGKPKQ